MLCVCFLSLRMSLCSQTQPRLAIHPGLVHLTGLEPLSPLETDKNPEEVAWLCGIICGQGWDCVTSCSGLGQAASLKGQWMEEAGVPRPTAGEPEPQK